MRRPDETMPWMPAAQQTREQPHDSEPNERRNTRDHFTPPRFYCIETICAPCGVVIAWAKFAKSGLRISYQYTELPQCSLSK